MATGATILICDDEELIRWSLVTHLGKVGFRTLEAKDGEECVDLLSTDSPDLIILDLKMPRMGGMDVLRHMRAVDLDIPVIVITAHGAVDSAIEATHLGARAYLHKPFDLREIELAVRKVLETYRLETEVRYFRQRKAVGYGQILGASPAMQRLFETLRRLEKVDAPTVLLVGESGTGKDLIASAIHENGPLGKTYGHGGWIPGYCSSLRYYPDCGVAIAFQINTDIGIMDSSTPVIEEMEIRLAKVVMAGIRN